jgi:hypothetical protein
LHLSLSFECLRVYALRRVTQGSATGFKQNSGACVTVRNGSGLVQTKENPCSLD